MRQRIGTFVIQDENSVHLVEVGTHMSRMLDKADFSQRQAWPTDHLERLREAIATELAAREHDGLASLERGLGQALVGYRKDGLL